MQLELQAREDVINERLSEMEEKLMPEPPRPPSDDATPPPADEPPGYPQPSPDNGPADVDAHDYLAGVDLFPKRDPKLVDQLKDVLRHHYVVAGHTDKAATVANAKLPSWFNVLGLKGVTYAEAVQANADVFLEFWNPFTTWWFKYRAWKKGLVQRNAQTICITMFIVMWLIWLYCAGKKHIPGIVLAVVGAIFQWARKPVTTILVRKVGPISDWCSGYWEPFVAKAGNWLKLPQQLTRDMKCQAKEYCVGFTARADTIWYPRQCFHNMLKALVKRQLLEPESDEATRALFWGYCKDAFEELFPFDYVTQGETPELLQAFLSRYPAGRRKMLATAWQTTLDGFHYVCAMSKAFVKGEWNLPKVWTKMDPRCISAKLDEYLMETAPVYWEMVKHYCKTKWADVDTALASGHFIYTSGLTGDQVGEIVTRLYNAGYKFVYQGDYSRYDGRTEKEALDAEFSWYKLPATLMTALRLQLETFGSSQGIKYGHRGKVCSGVCNTSFGNTVRGFMLIAGFCKYFGIVDYVVIQHGDDNILMFKSAINLKELIHWCKMCGHKLEITETPDLDFLEFCSARAVWVGTQWVFAPKFGRIIAKTFVASKSDVRMDQMGSYVTQIAEGFKNYYWLPVLGTFCKAVIHASLVDRKVMIPVNPYSMKMKSIIDVDEAAVRSHFFKVYGFDPATLESEFRLWEPELGTELMHPLIERMIEVDCA